MDRSHFIAPTLRPSVKRWQADQGFTLIEVMMVVAIIGVLAGVAVPGYNKLRAKMGLSSATSTLMGHLKQARHMAISESRSVSVTVSSSNYVFDSGGQSNQKNHTVLMSSFGNPTLNPSVGTLVFKSQGTATSANVVISTGTACKKIIINGIGRTYLATPPSPCP